MPFAGKPITGQGPDEMPDEGMGPESPRHGFRGNTVRTHPSALPGALSIAVSREAGSRGNSIGSRVGAKLGWPVYNHELLQYMAQEASAGENIADNFPADAEQWVENRLRQLLDEFNLRPFPSMIHLARNLLRLAVRGEAVIIGRGAGCILPIQTTLNVRIVAPQPDRIAYMSQWLRLTVDEATRQVLARDQQRADYLATHFHRNPADIYQWDLILNSSLLGEELCADLIVQSARGKAEAVSVHR